MRGQTLRKWAIAQGARAIVLCAVVVGFSYAASAQTLALRCASRLVADYETVYIDLDTSQVTIDIEGPGGRIQGPWPARVSSRSITWSWSPGEGATLNRMTGVMTTHFTDFPTYDWDCTPTKAQRPRF